MQAVKSSKNVIATILRFAEYGDPAKVVKKCMESLEAPITGKKLLVKILAAPINPADINTIQGKYPVKPEFPAVPGNECVASVLSAGSDSQLKEGDLVVPLKTGLGTWRSHAVLEEAEVMKVPNNVGIPEAASITVNPCTAYRMLKDFVNLKEGDTVIQNGANSSCGQSVIQLCKAWNIKTVNIVRDRPDLKKLVDYLTELGANEVLTEEQCRSTKLFKSGTLNKPKLALNCVGGKNALEMTKHLDNQGFMVTYGGMSREPVIVPTSSLIFKDTKFVGFWMTRWKDEKMGTEDMQSMFSDLFQLIQMGKLKAPAHEFVSVDNFEEALGRSLQMQGFAGSKILLKF